MKRFALALLVILAARTAGAREWRLAIEAGDIRVADGGFLALADTGFLSGFGAGLQVEVGWDVFAGLRVGVGSVNGPTLLGVTVGELDVVDLAATGRFHFPVLAWLRPFADVGVGTSRVALTLGDLDEARWTALVTGYAGLELRLLPEWLFGGSFSIALDIAGGYTWRSGAAFDDAGGTDLGTLDLGGAGWRLDVVLLW